jgi:hypothetical protein
MDKWTCVVLACLWTMPASAALVTIDPDAYAAGTELTSISPYVRIDTTGGAPVYAAPIVGTGQTLPSGITDTGPFGLHVFSREPDRNSEWFAWPDYVDANTDPYSADEWAKDPFGLRLTFTESITYISLLGLELFSDAGPGNDPLRWWIYDSTGTLIHTDYEDTFPGDGSIGVNPDWEFDYYYWDIEFSHPDIRTVIIGGESEPTTLDRLVFKTAIPEPGTLLLFATGLLGMGILPRRVRVT